MYMKNNHALIFATFALAILMVATFYQHQANAQTNTTINTRDTTNVSSKSVAFPISIVAGAANPLNAIFYDPTQANITVGTTVNWTNDDENPHTVTSGNPKTGPDDQFDSGFMVAGDTFSWTFEKAGTYDYFCILHPWMTGSVVVS